MNKQIKLYIVLASGVFFLSTSAIFVRVIEAPSHVIAFYRMFISVLLLLPTIFMKPSIRSEIKSLSNNQIILGLVSGLFLASHYVLWFESLNFTSIASSTVFVTLQPMFAVFGGYLNYKEKVGRLALTGITIAILGSVMIGWQDFQTDPSALYGDFLALTAAALITGYFFVGMAICSTLLGQMLINWVLKWLDTTTVSVFILSEVIWAIFLSYVLLHEHVTLKEVAGIVIIMLGLMIYILSGKLEKYFREKVINKNLMEEI